MEKVYLEEEMLENVVHVIGQGYYTRKVSTRELFDMAQEIADENPRIEFKTVRNMLAALGDKNIEVLRSYDKNTFLSNNVLNIHNDETMELLI